MIGSPYHERAEQMVRDFPFAVINDDKGFRIYHLFSAERNCILLSHMKHDTSREDPTLVADVLREEYDPEKIHKHWFHSVTAFFPTLEMAIERINAHEVRYGWERKHIEECRKVLLKAERDLRAAQQSQKHTVRAKFDCFGGDVPFPV